MNNKIINYILWAISIIIALLIFVTVKSYFDSPHLSGVWFMVSGGILAFVILNPLTTDKLFKSKIWLWRGLLMIPISAMILFGVNFTFSQALRHGSIERQIIEDKEFEKKNGFTIDVFNRGALSSNEGIKLDKLGDKDIIGILKKFTEGCSVNINVACHNKAVYEEKIKDFKASEMSFAKACDLQYSDSCVALVAIYDNGTYGQFDTRKAIIFAEKACSLNETYDFCGKIAKIKSSPSM